jgi:hypothetical protein
MEFCLMGSGGFCFGDGWWGLIIVEGCLFLVVLRLRGVFD